MPAWSSAVKLLSKLLGRGGSAAAASSSTKVAGEAVQAGARTVLTWGNAFKVAVAGGFTWLFIDGGLSNVVSSTLGIPKGAAQILVVFGFIVIVVLAFRYVINYMRDRYDLKREYFETPVFRRVGLRSYDEEQRRWERRYP
jgi:hypothetical protein